MGNYLSVPILALAAVLQASVMPQIRIQDGAPDLVFLIVLSWALRTNVESGLIWAFVGGIFQDVMSAAPTGASIIGMIPLVFLIGDLAGQVYRIGFLLIISLVALGTLFKQVGLLVVLALSGYVISPVDDFSRVILPTLIYNLVFIWPIYMLMRRIRNRFARDEHRFT